MNALFTKGDRKGLIAPKGKSRYAPEQGDVTALGELMHEHWLEKKRVSTKISNPKIDEWYECGLQNGALGGKVMGAGGGGLLTGTSANGAQDLKSIPSLPTIPSGRRLRLAGSTHS